MTHPDDPSRPWQDRPQQGQWQSPQQGGQGQWQPPQQGGQGQWQPPQQGGQGQWQPPQQGGQGQWQPPQQSAQGQWQPPQQPEWQSGQWQQPQDQWDEPAQRWNQAQGQPWSGPAPQVSQVPQVPRTGRRGRVLAASLAAVVVAGGAVATYAAVRSSDDTGAASAHAAVQKVVDDLNKDDLVGVLDDMAPNERAAVAQPFLDTVAQLKRTGVVRRNADLHKVGGVDFSARHLTFAAKTITVNDHVEIVQLTGGTLHVSADAAKLPLTERFLHAVAPHGMSGSQARSAQTVDIAQEVRASGKPVRIAVQESAGKWYPSLFYTIADSAAADAHRAAPSRAQRIPDVGTSSADAAVTELVKALLGADVRRAIELVSPDELGALHDYGALVVDQARYSKAPVTIRSIAFRDTPASGGGVQVHVRRVDVSTPDGDVSVTLDGACVDIEAKGDTKRMCADQIIGQIAGLGGDSGGPSVTPAQKVALTHLFAGITDIGIVATKTGGSWYVNPVRTYSTLAPSLLSHLQGDDMFALLSFAH